MNSNYIYFIGFLFSFPIVFRILFKLKFQELFKANNIWEIKVAFVIISLCICHLLGSFMEKFYLITN